MQHHQYELQVSNIEQVKLQLAECRQTINKYVKVAYTRLPSGGFPIPVLGSQPAGDVTYKPGGRLPLLSARPAVTLATLKRAATNFAAW